MDDHAFLAAIAADPRDAATRLVYADWLEERGSPRSELVRVEEEMSRLPPFSDRYWHLKPRRNELRKVSPPDWLDAMRYGTDCPPLFAHGVPEGVKERWRLVREFTERWHRVLMPDVGGRRDVVWGVQHQIGDVLPYSVREWIAFAHDARESAPECIRPGFGVGRVPGHPLISLYTLAGGDMRWVVREKDLTLPDPPAFFCSLDHIGDQEVWVGADVQPSIAWLALNLVFAPPPPARGFGTSVVDVEAITLGLRRTFPTYCEIGAARYFENDNIFVRLRVSGSGDSAIDFLFWKPIPWASWPVVLQEL